MTNNSFKNFNCSSDSYCLIFLHIPKTAGTTFGNFLKNAFRETEIASVSWASWFNGINDIHSIPQSKLHSIRLLRGHQPFGNHKYINRPCKYVTFVREPVERALSHYYFLQKGTDPSFHKLTDSISNENLIWNGIQFYKLFNNFQTRWLSNNIFGVKYPSMAAMLKSAISNLDNINVGITEHFDESIKLFIHKFNLKNINYESHKVSNRTKSNSLPPDLVEFVKMNNQFDSILYDFALLKFQECIDNSKRSRI